jgi:hypothetical protein
MARSLPNLWPLRAGARRQIRSPWGDSAGWRRCSSRLILRDVSYAVNMMRLVMHTANIEPLEKGAALRACSREGPRPFPYVALPAARSSPSSRTSVS